MELKPVPHETIPEQEWRTALGSLNQYSTAPLSNQNIHEASILLIWAIGQHWAYKWRWDSKHKIPYHRNLVTCIKPFGEMLHGLAELTTRCHADIPVGTVSFGNGAEWYAAVFEECRQDDISSG